MDILATIKITKTSTNSGNIFLVDNAFPDELSRSIVDLFDTAEQDTASWKEHEYFAHQKGRLVYQGESPLMPDITEYLSSDECKGKIEEFTNKKLRLNGYDLWADLYGYNISPHYDPMNPLFVSMQIYFPVDADRHSGTVFFQDHQTDLFQIPYRRNFGYIMDTGKTLLHGLHTIDNQTIRRSLHVRFGVLS